MHINICNTCFHKVVFLMQSELCPLQQAVKETGNRFRETVLALGGGKAPLEVRIADTILSSFYS